MKEKPSVLFLSSPRHSLEALHAFYRDGQHSKLKNLVFSHEVLDPEGDHVTHELFRHLQSHRVIVTRDPSLSEDIKALVSEIRGLSREERAHEQVGELPQVVHLSELKSQEFVHRILFSVFDAKNQTHPKRKLRPREM